MVCGSADYLRGSLRPLLLVLKITHILSPSVIFKMPTVKISTPITVTVGPISKHHHPSLGKRIVIIGTK